MKNLKKIKLANINESQIEKNHLNKVTGGEKENPCYGSCTDCAGAASYMDKSIGAYTAS